MPPCAIDEALKENMGTPLTYTLMLLPYVTALRVYTTPGVGMMEDVSCDAAAMDAEAYACGSAAVAVAFSTAKSPAPDAHVEHAVILTR